MSRDGRFDWEGEVYVRPLGRGVVLVDGEDDAYLDEIVAELVFDGAPSYSASDWSGRIRISIEVLPKAEGQAG
jgi:hypothetical protein